jgi:hypothetical protein
VGGRAGSIIPGKSAEDYLRESILDPSSHIAEGFPDSMYQNYGRELTDQEIADLVAFLANQK